MALPLRPVSLSWQSLSPTLTISSKRTKIGKMSPKQLLRLLSPRLKWPLSLQMWLLKILFLIMSWPRLRPVGDLTGRKRRSRQLDREQQQQLDRDSSRHRQQLDDGKRLLDRNKTRRTKPNLPKTAKERVARVAKRRATTKRKRISTRKRKTARKSLPRKRRHTARRRPRREARRRTRSQRRLSPSAPSSRREWPRWRRP